MISTFELKKKIYIQKFFAKNKKMARNLTCLYFSIPSIYVGSLFCELCMIQGSCQNRNHCYKKFYLEWN